MPEPGTDEAEKPLGAVVLLYRSWPGVCATIDALLRQSRPPASVLVVDNGSEESELSELEAAYPGIELVRAGSNRGYSAGMNLGIVRMQQSGFRQFLLLTHDCVLDPECLNRLRSRMDDNPRLGAVGPLLRRRDDPGVVWSAGGGIGTGNGHPHHLGSGEPVEQWRERPAHPVEWLDGACLLLNAEAVSQAGLLDERFFLYFEDAEYACRLKCAGWEVECVPAAVAAQEPSELPEYLTVRNRLGFMRSCAPRSLLWAELRRIGLNLARDSLRPPSAAQRDTLAERARGLFDFLRNRWGPPPAGRRRG